MGTQRITRRQFATGASTALLGASLHTRLESQASQAEAATPASPVAGPRVEVSPPAVAFDERFDILVSGVESGQQVTITSTFGSQGQTWTASATYTAHPFGYVDPDSMIPVAGSFRAADTMGFIWAAQTMVSPYYAFPQQEPEIVTITAAIGDVEIGFATLERSILASDEEPVEVSEDGLVGRFYRPAGDMSEPAPAVIVIGGSEGGLSPYLDLTASVLASHGYAALALAYWRIGDLPQAFEYIPPAYFGTAIDGFSDSPGSIRSGSRFMAPPVAAKEPC